MALELLGIPLEIRMLIYEAYFAEAYLDHTPLTLAYGTPTFRDGSPAHERMSSPSLRLLLACRQIYDECKNIAYRQTVFHIPSVRVAPESDSDPFGEEERSRSIPQLTIKSLDKGLSSLRTEIRALITHISIAGQCCRKFMDELTSFNEKRGLPALPSVQTFSIRTDKNNRRLREYNILTTILLPIANFPRLRQIVVVDDVLGRHLMSESPSTTGFIEVGGLESSSHWDAVLFFRSLSQMLPLDKGLSDNNPQYTRWTLAKEINDTTEIDHLQEFDHRSQAGCLGVRRKEYGGTESSHVHLFFGTPDAAQHYLCIPWVNECPNAATFKGVYDDCYSPSFVRS